MGRLRHIVRVRVSTLTELAPTGVRSLRKGRVSIANQIYHVTTATRHREPVFANLWAGRILVNRLRYEEVYGRARTLTFVVMPDHLHWLLQLTGQRSLSRDVDDVKGNSARLVNRLIARTGALWQRGFYDHAIRGDEDLVSVSRYIVANPIRAGIVDSVSNYALWDSVWL